MQEPGGRRELGATQDSGGPVHGRLPRVYLHGIGFHPITEPNVISLVLSETIQGRGGRIVTPNVDILRLARRDAEAREHIASATVVVADGAPLIWASRLSGRALPARVPGSDLIWSLSAAFASAGRSVYLLGGEPGSAEKAADVLVRRFPGLKVAGHASPPFGFDARPGEYQAMCDGVVATAPDLVYVGLGFPKQERVIGRLRERLPATWFMGCGAAIGFVAGTHRRAPRWMQRYGLEWLHRLAKEPHRLVRRYVVHDIPFATKLLMMSALSRARTDD